MHRLLLLICLFNIVFASYYLSDYFLCEEPTLDVVTYVLVWLKLYQVEKTCPSLESMILIMVNSLLWQVFLFSVMYIVIYQLKQTLRKFVTTYPLWCFYWTWVVVSEIRIAHFRIQECYQTFISIVMKWKRILGLTRKDDLHVFRVSVSRGPRGGILFRRISEGSDDIVLLDTKTENMECLGSYNKWRRELFKDIR